MCDKREEENQQRYVTILMGEFSQNLLRFACHVDENLLLLPRRHFAERRRSPGAGLDERQGGGGEARHSRKLVLPDPLGPRHADKLQPWRMGQENNRERKHVLCFISILFPMKQESKMKKNHAKTYRSGRTALAAEAAGSER